MEWQDMPEFFAFVTYLDNDDNSSISPALEKKIRTAQVSMGILSDRGILLKNSDVKLQIEVDEYLQELNTEYNILEKIDKRRRVT
jgi:hypothetical protein